ncbi:MULTISPECIES: NAD-dependent epimerase/dehydratase family protein [unclassified Cyanobium]|uniref:NAD-dependent epimerase/dehydratase family protein n=1 Tax=unclassified Cyanobium TaxID=2627006 RepID=UPI0021BCAE5D|nr:MULTISPECIES: NAD-dependent epimerase/dehydratase family protein [unclassified Cyanobium]
MTANGPILVTGVAGFIGAVAAERLLARGERVVGLDNLNAYYDPALKRARLERLEAMAQTGAFRFHQLDLVDAEAVAALFAAERPARVLHLAAQAGVRHSIDNPSLYIQSNLVGFATILEACRHGAVDHLVYASSSSIYGGNLHRPFSEQDPVNHPVSLYAATKKANELMAHTYSHLYGLPATGLRFFTVYGPWGRPDMAPMLFAKAILAGEPIRVFNHGRMERDFTYIDDIVEGVIRCLDKPATADPGFDPLHPDPATAAAPHRLFNIGNAQPVPLLQFIDLLEQALGRAAIRDLQPMQPGDVPATAADTTALAAWVGFRPATPIEAGIERFAAWYKEFHGP